MWASFTYQQLQLISSVGSSRFLLAFVILVPAGFLYFKKYKAEALLVLLSTLSFPYNQLLKGVFQTSRPEGANPVLYTPFDIYGFPSGHVVFYTVFFGYLLYLALKLKELPKLVRKVTAWVCVYFLLFVGVSRVGLGMHSMKDVFGGYFFGAFFLLVFIYLDWRIGRTARTTKEQKDRLHAFRKSKEE